MTIKEYHDYQIDVKEGKREPYLINKPISKVLDWQKKLQTAQLTKEDWK